MTTDYNKTDGHSPTKKTTDWTQFTEGTESAFAQTTIPFNIHTANIQCGAYVCAVEEIMCVVCVDVTEGA